MRGTSAWHICSVTTLTFVCFVFVYLFIYLFGIRTLAIWTFLRIPQQPRLDPFCSSHTSNAAVLAHLVRAVVET